MSKEIQNSIQLPYKCMLMLHTITSSYLTLNPEGVARPPVGVAAPARRLTLLGEASLSDSSPDELDISFMYPLSILLALSCRVFDIFLSSSVRVAGLRSKNPMITFWLSFRMSALFGSIVIASSLANA